MNFTWILAAAVILVLGYLGYAFYKSRKTPNTKTPPDRPAF